MDITMFSLLLPIVGLPLGFMQNNGSASAGRVKAFVVPQGRVGDPSPVFRVLPEDWTPPRTLQRQIPTQEVARSRQTGHTYYFCAQKTYFYFSRLATALVQGLATSLKVVSLLYWLRRNQLKSTPGKPAPENLF